MQNTLLPESKQSQQQNVVLFMMMIFGVLMLHSLFFPPPTKKPTQEPDTQVVENVDPDAVDGNETEKTDASDSANTEAIEQTTTKPVFISLGSHDPKSPYRMNVSLTNKGAAVTRIELNDPKYREVQDQTGYLGQIVADVNELGEPDVSIPTLTEKGVAVETEEISSPLGCLVQIVGPGTPADKAGLKPGDRIVGFTQTSRGKNELLKISTFSELREALLKTYSGDKIELEVVRSENDEKTSNLTLAVTLEEAPISIVRPIGTITTYEQYHDLRGLHGYDEKKHDQLSYLCSLSTIDKRKLKLPISVGKDQPKHLGLTARDISLENEIDGVNMRHGLWEVVENTEDKAVFKIFLPKYKLEITKTFQLAKKDDKSSADSAFPLGDYHLYVAVSVKNLDSQEREVAYMLDGPTGMPLEGGWYPRKTGPGWGIYGIRDVVVKFNGGAAETISNSIIANDRFNREPWKDDQLSYLGIDTQYFQCTMIPNSESPENIWHSRTVPVRVGEHYAAWSNLTDISFRTYSTEKTLGAAGEKDDSFANEYTIFAGPKKPDILAGYGLQNTISYGWFWFVAIPMLAFLHFIKTYLVFHYGLAIIVLTVCVRLLMFPMSRKQAINAAKNAALMPELQKIKEQYKGNLEAQSKAQRELWQKHNFNPLSGCLGIFIQLPIFIGLYKSLSIDVELYGTPLITRSLRWCTDLSAPDMLFDWSGFWNYIGWTSFSTGQGMLTLGPYFNLLPMLTIVLFMVQQAVMMPKATDDNMRMQQNMMKYMMIFMGLLFFKVPSGLCVYFIASSLWGLAERKLIPKYEFKIEDGQTPTEEKKPLPKNPTSSEKEQQPGTFGEMWKKLTEKASEPQSLQKADKKKKKRK